MVGVLVLINEHVAEALAVELRDLRVVREDAHDLTDEVVEVHRVRRAQALLVIRVHVRDGAVERIARLTRAVRRRVGADELVFVVRNLVGQHARGELLEIDLLFFSDHSQ